MPKRIQLKSVNNPLVKLKEKLSDKFPYLFGPIQNKKPINPLIVYGSIAGSVVLVFALSLPTILDERSLAKLGYSNKAINQIQSLKLTETLKTSYLYSDTLNRVFENGLSMNSQYLPLYTVFEVVDDNIILQYQRLIVKGYSQEDILNIFTNLKDYEISVLLTFQKLDDIQTYIDDCLAHPENSKDSFTLSNTYAKPYDELSVKEADSSSVTMLVNKFNYLTDQYTPQGLNELSVRYGANGVALAQEAASALAQMVDKFNTLGYSTGFYVSSGYRDFASQESIYQSYVGQHGQEEADRLATRAGFSEHQTGLALDIASTDYGKEFKDTTEFTWIVANCYDYGFILRYPEGKEYITQISYEPWHYRYLGVDTALAIKESGYTYDEYYELYLRPLPDNIGELIQQNQQDAIASAKFNAQHRPVTSIDPQTSAVTTIEPTLPSEK